MKEDDYVPYGPEWEKEMMKNSKATIVQITGTLGKQKDDLSETIQELKVWQEKTNAFVDKLGQENQKLKEDIALLKERDEKNGEGWAEDLKKLEAENQSLRDRVKLLEGWIKEFVDNTAEAGELQFPPKFFEKVNLILTQQP